MRDLLEVAERVREARKAMKMSQAALADAAGLSRSRVEAFETGRLLEMRATKLLAILHAVGLDLRLTNFNRGMPTLDDLRDEPESEVSNAPGMGR